MEMSPAYMAETVEVMGKKGFTVVREDLVGEVEEEVVYRGHRYVLKAEGEHVEVETLTYTDGRELYFFKLVDFHGLRSFSYPLDSWKWRDHQVEFKLVADPATATGLALTIPLPRGDAPAEEEEG